MPATAAAAPTPRAAALAVGLLIPEAASISTFVPATISVLKLGVDVRRPGRETSSPKTNRRSGVVPSASSAVSSPSAACSAATATAVAPMPSAAGATVSVLCLLAKIESFGLCRLKAEREPPPTLLPAVCAVCAATKSPPTPATSSKSNRDTPRLRAAAISSIRRRSRFSSYLWYPRTPRAASAPIRTRPATPPMIEPAITPAFEDPEPLATGSASTGPAIGPTGTGCVPGPVPGGLVTGGVVPGPVTGGVPGRVPGPPGPDVTGGTVPPAVPKGLLMIPICRGGRKKRHWKVSGC